MNFLAGCAILSIIIGITTLYYLAVVKPVDEEMKKEKE